MIEAAENSIIAEITTALTVNGKSLVRKIDTLPGTLNNELLKTMIATAPAVYIVWNGGRDKNSSDELTVETTWGIYILADSFNGAKAAMVGDKRKAGAYQIMSLILPQLHGHNIPDVGKMKFKKAENLFSVNVDKRGAIIYALTFITPNLSLPYDADGSILAAMNDFITYDQKYDLAKDPDVSVAEDKVTLPQ